jgi:hypothetical protein
MFLGLIWPLRGLTQTSEGTNMDVGSFWPMYMYLGINIINFSNLELFERLGFDEMEHFRAFNCLCLGKGLLKTYKSLLRNTL